MKCNQSGPGFELASPCPFPTMITITPRALPSDYLLYVLGGQTMTNIGSHCTRLLACSRGQLDTYLIMLSIKQGGIKYHLWDFDLTQPGIEPPSPRPLVNTGTMMPIGQFDQVGRVSINGVGGRGLIPGWVISKTQKMVRDSSLSNTQHHKVCIELPAATVINFIYIYIYIYIYSTKILMNPVHNQISNDKTSLDSKRKLNYMRSPILSVTFCWLLKAGNLWRICCPKPNLVKLYTHTHTHTCARTHSQGCAYKQVYIM